MPKGKQDRHHTNKLKVPQAGQSNPAGATWAGYEIQIKDHLETYWFDWFEGWEITNLENGQVLMRKSGVDHSELHGILNKVRDLNLTLISVTRKSIGTNNL